MSIIIIIIIKNNFLKSISSRTISQICLLYSTFPKFKVPSNPLMHNPIIDSPKIIYCPFKPEVPLNTLTQKERKTKSLIYPIQKISSSACHFCSCSCVIGSLVFLLSIWVLFSLSLLPFKHDLFIYLLLLYFFFFFLACQNSNLVIP